MDQRRLCGIKSVVSINSYAWLLSLHVYDDSNYICPLAGMVYER